MLNEGLLALVFVSTLVLVLGMALYAVFGVPA
jgi:hypothetical protein